MSFDMKKLRYQAICLPDEVKMYHYSGDFDGEIKAIDRWLARDISRGMRERLQLQRVFAEELIDDYPLSDDDMIAGIRERYPVADAATLEALIGFGNVDYILRGGKRCYQHKALSNIFLTHTGYLESLTRTDAAPAAGHSDTTAHDIIDEMRREGGIAYRYEVEEVISVAPAYERPGETLRIWFPYPVACDTQPASEIKLLSSSHPVTLTGDVLRTAYMEVPCEPGAEYSVRFSFVNRAKYHDLSNHVPDGTPAGLGLTPAELEEYTSEQYPHIRFTPFITDLADEIRGDETDPLTIARRIYDWICSHVTYSYLRDYLLIENIPEFVLTNGYGDCGTMGLAFITLCRACGIPATWQSGSSCRPTGIGSHDWTRFYVAPYGWLYCDPSYGDGAYRSGNTKRQDHYFGNLDCFRLVADNAFQVPLTPEKRLFRMDPYDNQNGEAEYADGVHNVFFKAFRSHRRVVSAEKLDYKDAEKM